MRVAIEAQNIYKAKTGETANTVASCMNSTDIQHTRETVHSAGEILTLREPVEM